MPNNHVCIDLHSVVSCRSSIQCSHVDSLTSLAFLEKLKVEKKYT